MNLMRAAYGTGDMEEEVSTSAMGSFDATVVRQGVVSEESGGTTGFVVNADALKLVNDGMWNDIEWVKPDVGEVVVGEKGIDWVDDFSVRLGLRQYGRMVRRDRLRKADVGTEESAERLLLRPSVGVDGAVIEEQGDGCRVVRFPDRPATSWEMLGPLGMLVDPGTQAEIEARREELQNQTFGLEKMSIVRI
jgi:hypothetical protein